MTSKLIPFLKWAGGKRWLAPSFETLNGYKKYIEPFVGGGAVFFSIQPKKSLLSDLNADLIDTYKIVRDRPLELAVLLAWHQKKHNPEHYYKTRAQLLFDPTERAARFIYLNRTCWNGLYRVNKKGEFNVPLGTKTTVIMESDQWLEISELLQTSELIAQDFEESIAKAKKGDLIFADPPYTVKHNLNGFLKYNEAIFTWADQVRLRNALLKAADRGVTVISTNAAHNSIRELYCDDFDIEVLNRASILAGKSSARGHYEELLITANYE